MRYVALAADYDGTLASNGQVASGTVDALRRLAASGRKLVLVTGRELDELLGLFPEIGVFDRVVAENGALLYCPATRQHKALGEPPPFAFVRELKRLGVAPLAVGKTIVATVHPNETLVLGAIRELGLELQVIFNKGAVMVLPASVNKATGLAAALRDLGLSPRNVVAIGDAENDHALLRSAEYGVAVANAVPMLQRDADRTSRRDHGDAVVELVDQLIADDLRAIEPPVPRRRILLGAREDGREVHLPPGRTSLLIAGSSGSGKSTLATGVLERLRAEGYQFCVIDPEGDYEGLADAIAFGSADRGPTPAEILTALEKPEANVVVNLIGVPLADRPAFFLGLLPRLQELRAKTGRPHWVLVDETHHLMPREWHPTAGVLNPGLTGMLYVTVHPDRIAPPVLQSVGMIAALGDAPETTVRNFAAAAGLAAPAIDGARLAAGEALVWSGTGTQPIKIAISPSHTERRRHRRKYAEGELPPDRSFYFRGPHEKLKLRARNLVQFLQLAEGIDEETWLHHLRQGDYSRWMRSSIKDDALGDEVEAIEREESPTAEESRTRIKAAVEERYTMPAEGAEAADLRR